MILKLRGLPWSRALKDDFFGRDDLLGELLTDIEKMLAVESSAENQGRFLTLIGPSGSGKSSVVMAGLLPQLRQGGKLTHSEQWVYLTPIVPGEHPLPKEIRDWFYPCVASIDYPTGETMGNARRAGGRSV